MNNPLNMVDPSGLCADSFDESGCGGGGFGFGDPWGEDPGIPQAQGPAHTSSHTPFPIPGGGFNWQNWLFGPMCQPDPAGLNPCAKSFASNDPCAKYVCVSDSAEPDGCVDAEVSAGSCVENGLPPDCLQVSGMPVCKFPVDKYNLFEKGKTNYRDSLPFCSTHVTVDNSTGETQSHVDLFNPGVPFPSDSNAGGLLSIPLHMIFDVIPDYIFRKTGDYVLPAGRTACQ